MERVEVKGKARLFKNPILEALTRTTPYLTLGVFVPLTIAVAALGVVYFDLTVIDILLAGVIGFFSWTLVEYLMHRYVFHFINDSAWSKQFHYMVHGVHHHYPKDEGRLFMPPIPGIIMASLFLGVFYLIMGKFAFAFFPGFVLGWLAYVFTHWAIHKYRKPSNALGYIWIHHNLHHFKYPNRCFGVSTPFWDHIFFTMPPKEERRKKAAA